MAIDKKVLHKAVQSGQHVFEMELDGNTIYVTVKEAQYHPVTEEIIHLDLLRVRRDVKMKFSIPLNLVGDAVGAVEGGIVSQSANLIDIECFPTDVPDSIDVDITGLELNGTLFASDIDLPGDTELLSPEDTTIAVCAPPKAEVEVVEEDGEDGEDGEVGSTLPPSVCLDPCLASACIEAGGRREHKTLFQQMQSLAREGTRCVHPAASCARRDFC